MNPKGESKQDTSDALPETGDKSENTNVTLFGAMMTLLGSLLLFRRRKQDHEEKA
ncbi:LPXTG cell wall anchor domain-containing protein [Staphylococcus schweitzeri]